MRPHPRIRKTAKWGGVMMTLLLLTAWIGSGVSGAVWISRSGRFCRLINGRIDVGVFQGPPSAVQPGLELSDLHRPDFVWWFARMRIPSGWYVGAPLWIPAAASFLCT